MCVWQSQAPPGTLKLTRVAGCAASANTVISLRSHRKAASPPAISPRRPTFLVNPRVVFVIRSHPRPCRRRICWPILIGRGEAFQLNLFRGGREWAYAGFTFAWICAFIAHYLAKDGAKAFAPLVCLLILAISHLTRPASRQCQAIATPMSSSQQV